MLVGTRVSLLVGVTAAVLATVLSLLVGLTAGYVGGLTDELFSALDEVFSELPLSDDDDVEVDFREPRLSFL